MVIYAIEGDTVDLVCWRELGRTGRVVEDVLLANPGLADLGPVLPIGAVVVLPDAVVERGETVDTVQLWD